MVHGDLLERFHKILTLPWFQNVKCLQLRFFSTTPQDIDASTDSEAALEAMGRPYPIQPSMLPLVSTSKAYKTFVDAIPSLFAPWYQRGIVNVSKTAQWWRGPRHAPFEW